MSIADYASSNAIYIFGYIFVFIFLDFLISYEDRGHGLMPRKDEVYVAHLNFWSTIFYGTMGFFLAHAYIYLDTHSIFNIDLPIFQSLLVCLLLKDFTFYLCHLIEHKVKLAWAFHRVHHSITEMNLRSGAAVHPLNIFSIYTFSNLLLIFIGLDLEDFLLVRLLYTIYMTSIHVSLFKPKEKPSLLSHFFITPSNHRVHHGTQEKYLNKNFGGLLAVYDRLFGTFQFEDPNDVPIYGLAGSPSTKSVWKESTVGFKEFFNFKFRMLKSEKDRT